MISVGVMAIEKAVHFRLIGSFKADEGVILSPGEYTVRLDGGRTSLLNPDGRVVIENQSIRLLPESPGENRIGLKNVPIGTDFHWQQHQDLLFPGLFHIRPVKGKQLQIINRLPLETYLSSVVASEMSGTAPLEFLKAHAVISRSWALRRMRREGRLVPPDASPVEPPDEETIFCWTDAGIHQGFDVCADDHCQRYRGILGGTASNPKHAVQETRGEVLTYGDELCDTRYSKCCGGMTENFSTAWDDREVQYLRALPDNDSLPPDFGLPLSTEENARAWITGSPNAFCNATDRELLEAILPPSDRPTADFYRWQTVYSQEEISRIITEKTGKDLGQIRDLFPLERGGSGRIIRLQIVGTRRTLNVGKELEIRRVLSPTHLYSSAIVIQKEPGRNGIPKDFRLIGAGWGHGVGLCQIGAAVMAERGRTYREIIQHYFPGTCLTGRYGAEEVR